MWQIARATRTTEAWSHRATFNRPHTPRADADSKLGSFGPEHAYGDGVSTGPPKVEVSGGHPAQTVESTRVVVDPGPPAAEQHAPGNVDRNGTDNKGWLCPNWST
jgi:hypothetical protein